jgi:acetyl esterase/lipase
VDYRELYRVVDYRLPDNHSGHAALAKGMVAYRCGRFRDAIDVLPVMSDGYGAPLSLLFRAMAHCEEGDRNRASELLEQGRKLVEEFRALRDQPDDDWLDYYESVAWCEAQVVLREAETLIESSSEQGQIVDGTRPVGQRKKGS